MNIAEPNTAFSEEMLIPEYWNRQYGGDPDEYTSMIMSISEWRRFQEEALKLLNSDEVGVCEPTLSFIISIINGRTPHGLCISGNDPMKRIR
jgi:hypothetical protein